MKKMIPRNQLQLSFSLSFFVAAVCLFRPAAQAASGAWNIDALGNWSTPGNWSPASVPGTATGDVVSLTFNLTAARTVTIDGGARLVGTLNIGDPTSAFYAYTLAASGGGSLNFNNGGLGANLVQLTTTASDVISAPLALADTLGVTNTSTLTLSGAISGAGKGIAKSGAGTLALNGANSFSGGVTLNGGRINLGSTTALGATAGTLTLGGGTTLDSSVPNLIATTTLVNANKNPVVLNGNFTFTGTQSLNLGPGPVSLGSAAGSRTVTVSANTLTLGGTLSNGVATNLTKAGSAGTLTLSGTNTYSGGTTVSAGALSFAHTAAQPASGATTVANGATLGLGVGGVGYFGSADLDALFANTFPNVTMNLTACVGIDTAAGSFTYATPLSGGRGLTKLGGNVLTIPVANAYSGVTAINAGVLRLDHASALPGGIGAAGGTSALTFNGGVLGLGAGDFTRNLGTAGTLTNANFTGAGGWAAYGADRVVNLGGRATPSTVVWATANTGFNNKVLLLGASSATHMVDLQNPIDLGTNTTRTVQVDDGAAAVDAQLSGVLSGVANANLSKNGAGTLALTAANTYGGSTTVQGGGTLMVTGAGSINSGNTLVVGANNTSGTVVYASSAASGFSYLVLGQTSANAILLQTSGTINVSSYINMSQSANSLSALMLSGGTLAVAGAVNVGQRGSLPATVTLSGTGVLTAGALVVGDFSSGTLSIGQYTQNGGTATVGTLLLAKSSTDAYAHSGTVDLNGGTLTCGTVSAGTASGAGSNTSTFNFNGGTLKPSADSATFMQGLTTSAVKDGGALFDTGGFDITVTQPLLHASGAINAPLSKSGAGALTLSGANTFAGPITVNGGSLLLTGPNLASRPTTVNSGTLALGEGAQLGFGSYSAAITNNGVLVYGSSADQTLSGVIRGAGALTLSGTGTLTLSGVNTYAGTTTVSAGKLVGVAGGSASSSDVSVASGATLGVRVNASESQWSCQSLTLGSGVTALEFRYYGAAPSAAAAPLLVTGDFINTGTLTVTLGGAGLTVGTFPLVRCAGALTAGTLGAVSLPGGAEGSLAYNAASGTIDLIVTVASTPLTWNGGSGSWDIGASLNWAGGLSYGDGDLVLFDDTSSGTAPFTVSLAADVRPASVTVDNPTQAYTFAGPGALSGETALTKSGAAELTLSGANTYSGGTTLSSDAGTVTATLSATQNSLGSGPVAIGSGSTVVLDNTNTSAAAVVKPNAFGGTGLLKLTFATNATARSTALPGLAGFAGTVQVGSAGSATGDKLDASGALAPAATVQIPEGNTLVVGNGYASASFASLSVRGSGNAENRGALRLAANADTLAGPITLLGDAVIASDLASGTLSGAIAGTAVAAATNVLIQGTAASAAGCVFSGPLSDGSGGGRLALIQNKGVLTLTGASTYSGGTTVQGGGTLAVGATDTLPVAGPLALGGTNGLGNLILSAGSQTLPSLVVASTNGNWLNTVTIAPGQTLAVNGAGGLTVGVEPGTNSSAACRMSGGGTLVVANPSALVLVGRASAFQHYSNSGTLDLSGLGSVTLGSADAGLSEIRVGYGMTCTGTLTLSNTNNLLTATSLTIGHSNNGNPGTGGTVILGAGNNVLAANTISIGLSKSAGSLKFASQAAGSPGTVTIGGRTRAGADFLIGGKFATGTGYTPVGILDLRGHLSDVTAGTVTLGKEDGPSNAVSGTTGYLYFDAGTFTATNLTMAAKSGLNFGAATATLTVSGGVFTVTEGGSFALASQAVNGSAAATLNLLGGTFTCNANILTGPSNCTGTVTLDGGTLDMTGHALGLAAQTVTVFNARSGTLKNLGQFNNSAPLVKTGNGTLTLDGTNTYTGATAVSNGTLQVSGASSLPATTDLVLSADTACQLTFDGTAKIHALYLDGEVQKSGVHGAGSLPAYLSGSGLLETSWPPPQGTVLNLR